MRFFSLLAICCCALHAAHGQLKKAPSNAVGIVGRDVTLVCSGLELSWLEYITSPLASRQLVWRHLVWNPVKYAIVNSSAEAFHLKIMDLALNDAGTYGCRYTRDARSEMLVEVVIFETDPICSSNTTSNVGAERDYIDLICWVKYKGKWAPTMRWQNEADEIPSKDESQGNMVKFSAVVQLMPSHNGKSFTCRTFFDQPEKGTLGINTAENFPVNDGAYPEVCTTPTFTVYYGPSSIVVSPQGNTYTVGTKLSASADSNPPANSYKWMDTKINDVLHTTSVLELTDSMVGEQFVQVEACNTLPDSPPTTLCNLAAFNFTVVTHEKNWNNVGIVVGGLIAFLTMFGAMIIFLCVGGRKKKKRRERSPAKTPSKISTTSRV
ncbi:hypothetical protein LSAT2_022812 [Lamellibrachia satsuma]|nr:hypothetical protein LSAT2_022812 [Lamellibrachia satsuma]